MEAASNFVLNNKEVLTIALALVGVFLTMLGLWLTMRRQTQVLQTQVSLEFFRRYADISKAMPDRLRFAKYEEDSSPLSDEERRKLRRSMIEYGNLCSEEFALWRTGRIPDDIWEVWEDGISENFETAIWRSTWAEVSREFESFEAFMKFMKELLLKAEKAAVKKVLSVPVH